MQIKKGKIKKHLVRRLDAAHKEANRLDKIIPGVSINNPKLNKEIQRFKQGVGK